MTVETRGALTGRVIVLALALEGALAALAMLGGLLAGQSPLSSIRWGIEALPQNAEAVGWGLLGSAPMLLGLAVAVRCPVGLLGRLLRLAETLSRGLFVRCSTVELALVGVAAGVGEEMFFRGLVQDAMGRWAGVPAGVLAASVLFGLAHPLGVEYAAAAALTGLWLGGLYVATGNLLSPIVAHAAYDFMALCYLVRRSRGHERQAASPAAESG